MAGGHRTIPPSTRGEGDVIRWGRERDDEKGSDVPSLSLSFDSTPPPLPLPRPHGPPLLVTSPSINPLTGPSVSSSTPSSPSLASPSASPRSSPSPRPFLSMPFWVASRRSACLGSPSPPSYVDGVQRGALPEHFHWTTRGRTGASRGMRSPESAHAVNSDRDGFYK